MANPAVQAIEQEIKRKQTEIEALKSALAALGAAAAPTKRGGGTGTRRPRTAAEKKALSKAMKAAWRRRKVAKAGPAAKGRKNSAKKTGAKKTETTAMSANG